jgi:rifampicin phosphotransferase
VDTDSLTPVDLNPVEVPPGSWLREATHCPRPLSPMFASGLPVVTETFRQAFAELGTWFDTVEYRVIGGWVYTRLVPLGGVEGQAPPPELMRQRAERAAESVRTGHLDAYLEEWRELRPQFEAEVARLRAVDLRAMEDGKLAEHLGEVLEFSTWAFTVHFRLHGISALMLFDLVRTCRELLGWDDVRVLELMSGRSEASTEPASSLARLTRLAGERPAVRRFLEGGGEDPPALAAVDPEFAAAFDAHQATFAFRAIRYEVADASMEETPSVTLRLIADQLRSGYDAAAVAAEVEARREALRAEARSRLAGRSEAERQRFDRVLRRAERWYGVREEKASMTLSEQYTLIRRVALEIGRRLAQRSVLDDADHVFFLHLDEAAAAIAGGPPGGGRDWRDLVGRRRDEQAWAEANPGPPFRGPRSDPRAGFDELPVEMRFVSEAELWFIERQGSFAVSHPQAGGGRLDGVAASSGVYTGPVRVLRSEADFDRLRPGDVLVCPITSPAWSVLFPNVGALVADEGAVLSHSAIIAREFQIPAVVATGNATSLLRDGQRVTVDGTAGVVEVLG